MLVILYVVVLDALRFSEPEFPGLEVVISGNDWILFFLEFSGRRHML